MTAQHLNVIERVETKQNKEIDERILVKEKELSELKITLIQKEEKINNLSSTIQENEKQISILVSKLQNFSDENHKLKLTLEEQILLHQDLLKYKKIV